MEVCILDHLSTMKLMVLVSFISQVAMGVIILASGARISNMGMVVKSGRMEAFIVDFTILASNKATVNTSGVMVTVILVNGMKVTSVVMVLSHGKRSGFTLDNGNQIKLMESVPIAGKTAVCTLANTNVI